MQSPSSSSSSSLSSNPASSPSSVLSLSAFRWRLSLSSPSSFIVGRDHRITAIAASNDGRCYVGNESGTISIYSIAGTGSDASSSSSSSSSAPSASPVDAVLCRRKVGKKPITALSILYFPEDTSSAAARASFASTRSGPNSVPVRAWLLALVDSKLLLLDTTTLATLVEIGPKESFAMFTVVARTTAGGGVSGNSSISSNRICATMKSKKKLHLYTIHISSSPRQPTTGSYDLTKELMLPSDGALALCALDDVLALGYKREYTLLDMRSELVSDVPVPLEGGVAPLLCLCTGGELLLSTTNSMGFLVNFIGEPLPKAPILWSAPPSALQACGGYVLGLISAAPAVVNEKEQRAASGIIGGAVSSIIHVASSSKDPLMTNDRDIIVAVASLMDQKQVQTVRLPRAGSTTALTPALALAAGPPTLLLTSCSPGPSSELVIVSVSTASGSEVYTFTLTSAKEQVEQYMDLGYAVEASALFQRQTPPPSNAALAEFRMRAGMVCLRELEFDTAYEFINKVWMTSSVSTNGKVNVINNVNLVDPRELIALYPDLTLRSMPYVLPATSASRTVKLQPTMSALIESARSAATHEASAGATGAAAGLIVAGSNNASNAGGGGSELRAKKGRKEILATSTLALMKQSRLALAKFLWQWRTCYMQQQSAVAASSSASQPQDQEMVICVDTAMAFLAVEFDAAKIDTPVATRTSLTRVDDDATSSIDAATPFPYTLSQLFFPSNSCLLHETEFYLTRERQYHALAMLFQSKGALRKALDVWRNMGTTTTTTASSPSSSIPGVADTVRLLSSLSDQSLLWEFSDWVLTASPIDGLRIFLSSARAEPLQPEKVLAFLRRSATQQKSRAVEERHGGIDGEYAVVGSTSPNASSTSSSSTSNLDLVESYLEYLINHEKSIDPKYHTQLALCYLKKVIGLSLPPAPLSTNSATKVRSDSFIGSGLSGLVTAQSGSVARFKPGHEPGLRGQPRAKLLKFLQKSERYEPAIVLQALIENQLAAGTMSTSASRAAKQAAANASLSSTSSTASPAQALPTRLSYSGLDPANHASNLYEELLLLCSRLGLHQRVLQIYLFDLRDEVGAAHYAFYISHVTQEKQKRAKEEREQAVVLEAIRRESNAAEEKSDSTLTDNDGGVHALDDAAIDHRHPGDAFLDLLDIYFSDEYESKWAEWYPEAAKKQADKKRLLKETPISSSSTSSTAVSSSSKPSTTTPTASIDDVPTPTDAALTLLNQYFHLMDSVSLLRLLPPTLPLSSLSHLFSRLFPSTLHLRRHARLCCGLQKLIHLRTQQHCYSLRSLALPIDARVRCSWCYKSIGDAVFVAHPYHTMRDPCDNQYVVDFEMGAIEGGNDGLSSPISSASSPPSTSSSFSCESDSVSFRHEMPSYVLVHYQCSAPFIINGGVETYMAQARKEGNANNAGAASDGNDNRARPNSSSSSSSSNPIIAANVSTNPFAASKSTLNTSSSSSSSSSQPISANPFR